MGNILECLIEFNKSENIEIRVDFGNKQTQVFKNYSNLILFNHTYLSIGRFNLEINEPSLDFVYSTEINITGIMFKKCPSKVNQSQMFTLEIVRWNFDHDVEIQFSDSTSQTLNKSTKYIEKRIDSPGLYSVKIFNETKVYFNCSQIIVTPWLISNDEIFELLKQNKFDLNDCLTNCSGNGFCKLSRNNLFRCECFKNSTGRTCEIDKNVCSINQCMNNGTCISKNNNTQNFECECIEPFYGKRCELFGTDFCEKKYKCESSRNCFLIMAKEPKCKCVNLMEGEDCSIESNQLKIIKAVKKNSWIISLIVIALVYLIFISIDLWNFFISRNKKSKKQIIVQKLKYIN